MPRLFSYQIFTIDTDYTHYFAQLSVSDAENLPNIVYRWDFGDGSPVDNGKDLLHEYRPGEYVVTLSKSINANPYVLVETAIAFVIAIPQTKLPSNQLQPISAVELFPAVGLKQSVMLPTAMLELGDTYSQNKSDYVNEYEESWSITTGFLTEVQKDRLEATFQQLGGVYPFNFVPVAPEPAVSLVCESWKVTQLSVNNHQIDYQISIQAKRFWSRPRIRLAKPTQYIWFHYQNNTPPKYVCCFDYRFEATPIVGNSPFKTSTVVYTDMDGVERTASYFTEDNFWGKGANFPFDGMPPICVAGDNQFL